MYHNTGKRKEDTSEINFLMLNHILPKKGVKNGLEVFQKVKKKYKNCKLRMFGMCDNSNLPDDVEYYQKSEQNKNCLIYIQIQIYLFSLAGRRMGINSIRGNGMWMCCCGDEYWFCVGFRSARKQYDDKYAKQC